MRNYFSHDSNARNDEKLIRLRMRHKAAGYGVYFMILERMREADNYMCVRDYNIIAFDLREDAALIKSVVEDFGLFVFTADGKYFYSESFLQRMQTKDDVSQVKRNAAKARWDKVKEQQKAQEPERKYKEIIDAVTIPADVQKELIDAGLQNDDVVQTIRLTDALDDSNPATKFVERWLDQPQRQPYYIILQHMEGMEQRGEIHPRYNYSDFRVLNYIATSDKISQAERLVILSRLNSPVAIDTARTALNEWRKGGIKMLGKYLNSELNKIT